MLSLGNIVQRSCRGRGHAKLRIRLPLLLYPQVPDTQLYEIEPFVASMKAVPKSGMHNPLKDPERSVPRLHRCLLMDGNRSMGVLVGATPSLVIRSCGSGSSCCVHGSLLTRWMPATPPPGTGM